MGRDDRRVRRSRSRHPSGRRRRGGDRQRAEDDRDRPRVAERAAARPLRERDAAAGRSRAERRHRARHRQRRLEGDRRRADRALRHDRHRLRGDERQRPDLRRRASRWRCSTTSRSSGPSRRCWRRSAAGWRSAPPTAGVEIPGGEVCQVPEVLRGHPSPYGFDLVGSAFGVVGLDAIIDGSTARPGDVMIGLPASGIHSNGYDAGAAVAARRGPAHARRARRICSHGQSVADVLLEPTVIYVRAILALISQRDRGPRARAHHRRRRC